MNSIEKVEPWLELPKELWNKAFGNLSHRRVFFIFPQVSKACAILVEKYRKIFDNEEKYWENLCLEEKHESWDGINLKPIEKGPYLSWKKVYLASQPSYYICKNRKYCEKKSQLNEKIASTSSVNLNSFYVSIKKYVWWNTEQEIAAQIEKSKLISLYNTEIEVINQKREKLFYDINVEKTVISAIGKNRFNQIPFFKDCLHSKGLPFENSINKLCNMFIQNPTFPNIVRGETILKKKKFVFLHSQIKHNEKNALIGNLYIFIFSDKNTLNGCSREIYLNGLGLTSMLSEGMPDFIIETLQNWISNGYDENCGVFSKGKRLEFDFLWQ